MANIQENYNNGKHMTIDHTETISGVGFSFSEVVPKQVEPANKEVQVHDSKSVYPLPLITAKENGELDVYCESRQLNQECARAIQAAIHDNNYEQYRYDMKSAYNSVVSEYGVERVNYVLANTLQYKDYDGRFSLENKAWGNGIAISDQSQSDKADFVCEAHPALLDGFIGAARKEQASILNKLRDVTPKQKSEQKPMQKKPHDLEV